MSEKKTMDKLDQDLKIIHDNGLRYAEYQVENTLGRMKIANGVLYKKNRRGEYEPYNRNNQK